MPVPPVSAINEVMETTVLALGASPPLSFVAWILVGLFVGVFTVMLVAVARRGAPEEQPRRAYVTAGTAGVVGGAVGGWAVTLFGVDAVGGGIWVSLLFCVIGAVILLWIVGLVTGRRKK